MHKHRNFRLHRGVQARQLAFFGKPGTRDNAVLEYIAESPTRGHRTGHVSAQTRRRACTHASDGYERENESPREIEREAGGEGDM